MPRYSEEFKEKIVQKMMAPNSMSVAQVSRDAGISEPTLYSWRNKYQNEGKLVPADPFNPENWSGKDKLAVVIETAASNEHELSEYCRQKGLYAEQVTRWKEGAATGNDSTERLTKAERSMWQKDKKKTRQLEKELRRKEKTLAEAAALLILEKKAQAIWGGKGEE